MLTVIISLLLATLYDVLKAIIIKSRVGTHFYSNKKVTDFGILILSTLAIIAINVIEIMIIVKANKEIRDLIMLCSILIIAIQLCFMTIFDRYMSLKNVNKHPEKQSKDHDLP